MVSFGLKNRGFTLLELLIAISIFTTLGLGGYQMLQTVSDSHERVRSSAKEITELNIAFSIIQRDFNQFAPRGIRDRYGETMPPIVFENDEYLVEFTRGGWSNPSGRKRSRLQRVAYSMDYEEKTLTRHFWEVLDRAEDSEPISQVLLTGVTGFRLSGFSDEKYSEQKNSFFEEESGSPLAVEVVITTEGFGENQRLFQMVDSYFVSSTEDGQFKDASNVDEG